MTGIHVNVRTSGEPKFNFGPSVRITISNPDPVHYIQESRDAYLLVLRQVSLPNLPETFLQTDFRSLWDAGKISCDPHFFNAARQELSKLNPGIESSRDLPSEVIEELDFYKRLVYRVEQMRENKETSLTDKSLRRAIPKAYGELVAVQVAPRTDELGARKTAKVPKMPKPATFRSWRRQLIKFEGDLIALRDGRSGRAVTRRRRIADDVSLTSMSKWVKAYLDSSEPSVKSLHEKMEGELKALNVEREAEGLPQHHVPSLSTFERAIRQLDKGHVVLARKGFSAARRGFKLAARRTAAIHAGDRVSLDNWRTNLMSLKLPRQFWDGMPEEWHDTVVRTRFNLCAAVCEASKVVLGVRISLNASAETSLRTLEMVCRDKTDFARAAGCSSTWDHRLSPLMVPTDSGSEFIDENFRAAVRDIGATDEIGPVGRPDVRPTIERFFGTLDTQLLHHFTGRTGRNPVGRGEYDAEAMASITVEVLNTALVRYIVDVYHNKGHSGLGGETPNDAWDRLNDAYGVLPPPDPARMRAIFGFGDQRRIGNRGVRFLGLNYRSRRLAELRRRIGQGDILMRADMSDLGHISVRDFQHHGPWFTVPCETEEMVGTTAAEWIATGRELKRRYADAERIREDNVIEALRDIRKLGLDAAERFGIGPTTLLGPTIKALDTELFRSFGIYTAKHRGRSLEGMLEGPDGDAPLEPRSASLTTPPEGAEIGVDEVGSSRGRRRRGGAFLIEE